MAQDHHTKIAEERLKRLEEEASAGPQEPGAKAGRQGELQELYNHLAHPEFPTSITGLTDCPFEPVYAPETLLACLGVDEGEHGLAPSRTPTTPAARTPAGKGPRAV